MDSRPDSNSCCLSTCRFLANSGAANRAAPEPMGFARCDQLAYKSGCTNQVIPAEYSDSGDSESGKGDQIKRVGLKSSFQMIQAKCSGLNSPFQMIQVKCLGLNGRG